MSTANIPTEADLALRALLSTTLVLSQHLQIQHHQLALIRSYLVHHKRRNPPVYPSLRNELLGTVTLPETPTSKFKYLRRYGVTNQALISTLPTRIPLPYTMELNPLPFYRHSHPSSL